MALRLIIHLPAEEGDDVEETEAGDEALNNQKDCIISRAKERNMMEMELSLLRRERKIMQRKREIMKREKQLLQRELELVRKVRLFRQQMAALFLRLVMLEASRKCCLNLMPRTALFGDGSSKWNY